MEWRDWSPRFGVAFDLFGNGKTAVKAGFSRYVNWDATGLADAVNPAGTSGGTLLRSWNDVAPCSGCISRDFIPQGDPTNPLANGEIGPSPNANWGTPIINTRYDPEWSNGWGVRDFSTERSISVQQELRSNVSVSAGYFYRGFGNFTVVDNLATTASDYDSFCITAPSDARLPDGGGNRICGLYDLKPASVGRVDNVRTLAKNYGNVDQNYKGFDMSLNLRLPKTLLQGGFTTGRELFDSCDITLQLPERIAGSTKISADECHQQQPLLTQVKILGSYQLPWAFSVSGTYQNAYNATSTSPNINPGAPRMGINADYVATNAQISPSLGRNLSAGSNATVNVVKPGSDVGGSPAAGRSPTDQGVQERSPLDQGDGRRVQPLQHEYHHRIQPQLRDQWRRVVVAGRRSPGTVGEVRGPDRLLAVSRGRGKGRTRHRWLVRPSPFLREALQGSRG